MILRALYEYYLRCKNIYDKIGKGDEIPPLGFENNSVDFVVLISEEGKLIDILGKCETIMPRPATNKTSGDVPNILWDKAEYMLNLNVKDKVIEEEISDRCKTEVKIVNELVSRYPNRKDFAALQKFYVNKEFLKVMDNVHWSKIAKNPTVTFKLKGENMPMSYKSSDLENYVRYTWTKNPMDKCLITGQYTNIMQTTASTPLGIATNGKLVSFQKDCGYDSQGKTQGLNAPISIKAECAYSLALKMLMSSKKNNVMVFNRKGKVERILLFWTTIDDPEWAEKAENDAAHKLDDTREFPENDAPDDVETVKTTLNDIKKRGTYALPKEYEDDNYYFLELAPTTKGRIAIVFWNECPIPKFLEMIEKHTGDMSIESKFKVRYDAVSMVNSASLMSNDKGKKRYTRREKTIDSVFKSIIIGCNYPDSLFGDVLSRIYAEQTRPDSNTDKKEYCDFEYRDLERAAICKAYLIRNFSKYKITKDMDTNYNRPSYLCGRLFAILEWTQENANHDKDSDGWKSDLRIKYMNAAMSSPATVFPVILANSNYHIDKLNKMKKDSIVIKAEKLKQEIIGNLTPKECFPAMLSIQDQGCFFVGYYQQRQALLSKKEDENKNLNN